MCGITGWFSKYPLTNKDRPSLESMTNAISHRGPDGYGILLSNHAALGHSRLAIIDVEGGKQPMSIQNNSLSIVFNGEIYNFSEIRESLLKKGAKFRTKSDTEVIIRLYQEYGPEGFSYLRGMFAFAIWDKKNKLGILARDHSGIKPLFIRKNAGGDLFFASEAKAIFAGIQDLPELDEGSLNLLMNFRYIPGEKCLFRNITQLRPGHVLLWHPNGDTSETSIDQTKTDKDINIIDALHDSVRVHLVSDVNVGAYLSGGIDSATIVALASKYYHSCLQTFTLDIGDDPNEAYNAAVTAKLLNVENIIGYDEYKIDELLPRLIWHLEVPKINAIQSSMLAKLASKEVKVVLSGLGGDELFYGYNVHRIMNTIYTLSRITPNLISRPLGTILTHLYKRIIGHPWSENERTFTILHNFGNWPRVYGILRNLWDCQHLRSKIYGPRMLDSPLLNAYDTLTELWPTDPDPVSAMAKYEWKQKMVNDLLWQEDRVSMAEGLEVRVPFVDTCLSNSVNKLNRNILMPFGKQKAYMKGMVKKIIPDEILKRPKSGFQVNSPEFFNKYLSPLADEILSDSSIRDIGLFNPEFVSNVRKYKINRNYRWHYFMLYLILGTHLWVDLFERNRC